MFGIHERHSNVKCILVLLWAPLTLNDAFMFMLKLYFHLHNRHFEVKVRWKLLLGIILHFVFEVHHIFVAVCKETHLCISFKIS